MNRLLRLLGVLLTFSFAMFGQSSRDQVLQLPFQSGVTHAGGDYGFTTDNYLVEGSKRINTLGASSIFVYMVPEYRTRYPDKSVAPFWPAGDLHSLTELAQTAPYKALFDLPFKTFVITAYSFAAGDHVANFATDPSLAGQEEEEFYELTRYLLTTYAGTGKTFILKHWEGDYIGLQGFDTSKSISPSMVDAMNIWLTARQRGISRARNDLGNPAGVGVFHAVEMSRVLDYSRSGLTRVVNAVVPVVKPDMVSYSSYEATLAGSDPASATAVIREALDVIKNLAPDPLGLGDKRILISEYGLFENERPADEVAWRTTAILQAAQAAGISGAYMWQVFDNECHQSNGSDFPTDASPGDPLRPANSQCRGLWLVKPDGAISPVLSLISPYWKPSSSGNTITGRVTSAADGSGLAGARIEFYGGQTTADGNGNFQLAHVPSGSTQLTASASGYQNHSITIAVGSQNTANFALIPANAAGSVAGKVVSAINGAALSGVTVKYSGGSTTTDSTGAFKFIAIPGGTYDFTAQLSGWVPFISRVTVQPGITSVLNLSLATGAKIAGRVTNTSGAAVAEATVILHGGLVPTNVTMKTDSNGNYASGWVAIGSYQAQASAGGYPTVTASVTLTTGATTTNNFVLGAAVPNFTFAVSPSTQTVTAGQVAAYTVQVTPVQGFTGAVTLSAVGLPVGATASFNPAAISSGSSALSVTTTTGTAAGTYGVTINGVGGGLLHSSQITLVVKAKAVTGAASGRVTRASDGTGIQGATISSSSGNAVTDASGNYILFNLPAGSVLLTASATGFNSRSQTVNITAGQTTTANFALASVTPTGAINGRITSALNGAALAGATVSYSRGSTTSDANGNYSFKSVPAGTYTVTAQKSGWVAAGVTVSVASTAVTANIRLATGGKFTGKVINRSGVAISGASVKMTGGLVPTTITVVTNSSGIYTSPWISIGNYTVQASKSGYTTQSKSASVDTGATATVNFTLQ
jgi:Carboxypeptidase regulatory-like domain